MIPLCRRDGSRANNKGNINDLIMCFGQCPPTSLGEGNWQNHTGGETITNCRHTSDPHLISIV